MADRRANEYGLSSDFLRWLKTPDSGEPDIEADRTFARWILGLTARERIFRVGTVFVDMAVVAARFRCVPERCAPGAERGRFRSCCADIDLVLTRAEEARLGRHARALSALLLRTEPRLSPNAEGLVDLVDPTGEVLRRPDGRCVFSAIDGRSRIRCRLHRFARAARIPTGAIQPLSCRLFPLVLVNLGRAVLLTVVHASNYRAWQALPPWRFPCLSDPDLPPLIHSMRATLDELFGGGFASELEKMRKRISRRPSVRAGRPDNGSLPASGPGQDGGSRRRT